MKLKAFFDVFSRRQPPPGRKPKPLSPEFRNRVLILCRDELTDTQQGNQTERFWAEIHQRLQYLHGKPRLSDEPDADSQMTDALAFLLSCSDEHYLDFVEYIFRVERIRFVKSEQQELVNYINQFFRLDDLPYYLTDYVTETRQEDWHGTQHTVRTVVAFPQIIRRDHDLIHDHVVEPALTLLKDPKFSTANQEFLEALDDYRKGDYGDCLTKCGSTFESVMKIICETNRWTYQQTDTAGSLLKTVLYRSGIESFFEQPLLVVATVRNRLSKSHGAGTQPRKVSPNVAQFAVNATAAAIVFLVAEAT